jgi:Fe-S cluster assembly ATPase SufC
MFVTVISKTSVNCCILSSQVLAGHPEYEVTGGTVLFKGENLIDMEPEERSLAGLFMSFQAPVEIPGVNNYDFLLMALNARREKKGLPALEPLQVCNLYLWCKAFLKLHS